MHFVDVVSAGRIAWPALYALAERVHKGLMTERAFRDVLHDVFGAFPCHKCSRHARKILYVENMTRMYVRDTKFDAVEWVGRLHRKINRARKVVPPPGPPQVYRKNVVPVAAMLYAAVDIASDPLSDEQVMARNVWTSLMGEADMGADPQVFLVRLDDRLRNLIELLLRARALTGAQGGKTCGSDLCSVWRPGSAWEAARDEFRVRVQALGSRK